MIVIAIFMVLGALFIAISALGVLRFGDLYSRIHAVTKAASFGLLLIALATVVYFSTVIVVLKIILVLFFIFLTAPLSAHSIAKSNEDTKDDAK